MKKHNYFVKLAALALALVSLTFALLPGTTVSFTKPGKNKVLATVNVSGLETLTFHAPEELLHPTDSKGKAIYQEEAKDGELNAAAVEDLMQKLFKSFSISSWITMVLILAGIAAVLAKKDKKLPILLFLLAFVARLVTWLLSALAMPRSIGSSGATAFLYVSLPLLLFAAFFSNFVNEEELPKKYKLFLMMLPFLVAVFLAFATGTSWGTFSILVPIVCHAFPDGEMLVVSIAACLSGAVCGDHCSPISDTTIMASAGAHCSHVNHVSTQLPYAMTAAAISAGCYLLCGAAQAVLGDAANTLTSFVLLACAIVIELVVLSIVRARMGHTGKEEVTKS